MTPEMIAKFVQEMREKHAEQVEAVALPEGTAAYLEVLLKEHDLETVEFLLKLSYLMGLQTGFAAAVGGARGPEPEPGRGPLQA